MGKSPTPTGRKSKGKKQRPKRKIKKESNKDRLSLQIKKKVKEMIENGNANIITDADGKKKESSKKYLYDILAIKKETSKP